MAPGPPQMSGAAIIFVFLLSAAPVADSVKCPAGCYCDERRSGMMLQWVAVGCKGYIVAFIVVIHFDGVAWNTWNE